MTRNEKLYREVVSQLVAELAECRALMQFYADNHLAKEPPQVDKARTNLSQVSSINDALLQVADLFVQIDKQPGDVGYTDPTHRDPFGQGDVE